jgi:hypothetical protein
MDLEKFENGIFIANVNKNVKKIILIFKKKFEDCFEYFF